MKRIRQEVVNAGEGVGDAALPVRVEAHLADLAAEFYSVIAARPIEIIDERERVRRIGLAASILRTISSN